MAEGIEVRTHAKGTSYRASVWDAARERRIRKTFGTMAAAKAWRSDASKALRSGANLTPSKVTVDAAVAEWIVGAKDGTIRTRGRAPFKPGTIRIVERSHRLRLSPELGARALSSLRTTELQDYVDRLDREGMNANTIAATILPLRLVYRRAKGRGVVPVDPTDGLELPERTKGKRLPPSPKAAGGLLGALGPADRPLWATAMFAGLRRGELMALRWEDVDLSGAVLHVERSYDVTADEFLTPKSKRSLRTVPIVGALSPHLRDQMMRSGRREGLVFGRDGTHPFDASGVQKRADAAWKKLERVTLHQCRHLYASMSIAAGVNAHALSRYMGHSSIETTYDLYGHLLPGNESEAAALLDAYLVRELAAV
jgi:integrase